jgi:hypothetical protein
MGSEITMEFLLPCRSLNTRRTDIPLSTSQLKRRFSKVERDWDVGSSEGPVTELQRRQKEEKKRAKQPIQQGEGSEDGPYRAYIF